ncbi:MAG TPA: hypothetical protein VMI10_17525 [Terriglobales bacterium]|nr:hypothetical protein [Terriglobales bacterium]
MTDVCKRAILASLVLMTLAWPAWAQLQIGDDTSLNLSGNLSFAYTGNYSNLTGSTHGMTPSGNADLSGFYYSPNFLSFDIQPFYDQTRDNSTTRSVFHSSGVSSSASLFSGSHFPGSISYSKLFNGQGGYSLPGVGSLATHGNSDNLAIGWGINLPDLPRVGLQFTDGGSNSTVVGSNSESNFHNRLFGVNVADVWKGFNWSGDYHHDATHAEVPQFLVGTEPDISNNSSNTFSGSASHKLPLQGTFSFAASRANVSSESGGQHYNGSITDVGSGAEFAPVKNLDLGVNENYTTNVQGGLYESVLASGGVVPNALSDYTTHSLDLNIHASYVVPSIHLTFGATEDHRQQTVLGTSISANILSQMVTYGSQVFGGFFNADLVVTETQISQKGAANSIGQYETVSYFKNFRRWKVNGSFNYSRNTQTALIGYTSSGHGYSAGIGRRLSEYSFLSLNATANKATFGNSTGTDNSSQSYSASLTMRRFSLSGGYDKASGTSILTATGLMPITTPTPGTPFETFLFNGKSYSFGASTSPIRGLVLSGNYSHTRSDTFAAVASLNKTAQLNTMLQYKVRQLWIVGGYLKLQQEFSITGQPAASDSSFYFGITRWFKFF